MYKNVLKAQFMDRTNNVIKKTKIQIQVYFKYFLLIFSI